MGTNSVSILIVGGGIYGITTAIELQSRGYAVTVLEPGPIPHPDAASTDISKVVRLDYGKDELYLQMMAEALPIWRHWNEDLGETVFHETGVLYFTLDPMGAGDFEYESLQLLAKHGYATERLDSAEIKRRYPAWNAERYQDGYFNPQGGWAASGRVLTLMAERAAKLGVTLIQQAGFKSLLESHGRVTGVAATNGQDYHADQVLFCTGAWTPVLLPQLSQVMWPTAQAVFHFQAEDVALYQPPHFPVWTADVGKTGWYGFPALDNGTLKLANHGIGWQQDPHLPRHLPAEAEARFRAFFAESLPGMTQAPKLFERLCFYCDTFDGDFWIDHDPDRPGLMVSAGGSGHAFKFTPLLGKITADVLEGKPNPYAPRFAWRARGALKAEEARAAAQGVRK